MVHAKIKLNYFLFSSLVKYGEEGEGDRDGEGEGGGGTEEESEV